MLDPGWIDETVQLIQSAAASGRPLAGIFRYACSRPMPEVSLRDRLRSIARLFVVRLGTSS
jgi:hypothetical protein